MPNAGPAASLEASARASPAQIAGRNDAVEQPQPERVLRGDPVAEHQHLGGACETDDPRQQPGRAHVGAGQPDLREEEREARLAVAATRKSHASAMTAPAPAAMPLTAAITGRGSVRMFLTSSPVMLRERRAAPRVVATAARR